MSVNILQRREGETALSRSIYGAGGSAVDALGILRTKVLAAGERIAGWILLPPDAPDWAQDRTRLWQALASAERQYDAQEARRLDLTIPREIPEHLYEALATWLFADFQADRLPIQVDVHVKPASDGRPNVHLHAVVSTRPLEPSGFSRTKVRVRHWNRICKSAGPGGLRRRLAARLNAFLANHDLPVRVDARRNESRGLPPAETSLPRSFILRPTTVAARAALARQERQRAARRSWEEARDEVEAFSGKIADLEMALSEAKSAAIRFVAVDLDTRPKSDRMATCAAWAAACHAATEQIGDIVAITANTEEWCLFVEAGEAVLEGVWATDEQDLVALFDDLGWTSVEAQAPDPIATARWRRAVRPGRSSEPANPAPTVGAAREASDNSASAAVDVNQEESGLEAEDAQEAEPGSTPALRPGPAARKAIARQESQAHPGSAIRGEAGEEMAPAFDDVPCPAAPPQAPDPIIRTAPVENNAASEALAQTVCSQSDPSFGLLIWDTGSNRRSAAEVDAEPEPDPDDDADVPGLKP